MPRFLAAVALFSLATALPAQTIVVKSFETGKSSRWTPEALASAKPLPLPRVSLDLARKTVDSRSLQKPFKEIFPNVAEEPTLSAEERARFRTKLHDFTADELRALRGRIDEIATLKPAAKNYGTGGLDYTSSRLIPSSAIESFPYSPVGKLFLSDGTSDFVCSAALITRRLVITAGHCVHDGPGLGFFEDFLFVPAYLNGNAPFGSWEVSTAFVTDKWANSGQIPNENDFALLEMVDQNGQRIFEVTGKLAFVADLLADNHLHLLGYPTNLDDGEEIHQITSGDWFAFNDGTVAYGSDMGGGSSGGPWIQNFNRKAQGQGGGQQRARAAVVGVTSYGFLQDAIRAQGASILTRDFKVLRQEACFNQTGNC